MGKKTDSTQGCCPMHRFYTMASLIFGFLILHVGFLMASPTYISIEDEYLEGGSNTIENTPEELKGISLFKKGKYEASIVSLEQALKDFQKSGNKIGEIRINLELVNNYISLHQFDKAGLNLELIQFYLKETPKSDLVLEFKNAQIALEVAKGDYKTAYHLSQELNRYKDSLFEEERKKHFVGSVMVGSDEKKKISHEEAKNQILETRQRYTLLIGILLVTLLMVGLIFLYSLYRSKRHAFTITENANILIHQKNEELERLNQLKNKLFSIIAHDVRSPLNNLAGVLSLIGQGVLQHDEVQQITGKLTSNVKETTNFLDNLLIWSRSQMNGIRIHLQELDMYKLANETVEVFRFQCEEKKLTLENHVQDTVFVYADREMIRMVLRNLVSNAIKFSIPGGTILIKGTAKAEDDFAVISVSDDGIGVKKEFQDKLFGIDNYTTVGTMEEKGSGIGLMLCRDFVERNGGKIWMESTQNKGSNFYFSLPQYHMAKRDEGIKNLLADIL